MDKKKSLLDEYIHNKSSESRAKRNSFFHKRNDSPDKERYTSYTPTYRKRDFAFKYGPIGNEEEPITSLTYDHSFKNKHRSAEEGSMGSTSQRDQENRAHSARESHRIQRSLGNYLPSNEEFKIDNIENVSFIN
jgi:hypothetical protein